MAEKSESTNIWKQMSYVPPRGPCGFKNSLMSPACACLRFMIHPVKAATTFECDGCAHHASYHKMDNKAEDEVLSRWRNASGNFDREAYMMDDEVQEALSKRQRLGITRGMSSTAEGDLSMPEKARSTLVGSRRKRSRVTSDP
ncbi:hypothetical protein MMC30_007961 [Trapelia coarctata]|nr:hypothetical protein [Trapelia coarctata]